MMVEIASQDIRAHFGTQGTSLPGVLASENSRRILCRPDCHQLDIFVCIHYVDHDDPTFESLFSIFANVSYCVVLKSWKFCVSFQSKRRVVSHKAREAPNQPICLVLWTTTLSSRFPSQRRSWRKNSTKGPTPLSGRSSSCRPLHGPLNMSQCTRRKATRPWTVFRWCQTFWITNRFSVKWRRCRTWMWTLCSSPHWVAQRVPWEDFQTMWTWPRSVTSVVPACGVCQRTSFWSRIVCGVDAFCPRNWRARPTWLPTSRTRCSDPRQSVPPTPTGRGPVCRKAMAWTSPVRSASTPRLSSRFQWTTFAALAQPWRRPTRPPPCPSSARTVWAPKHPVILVSFTN